MFTAKTIYHLFNHYGQRVDGVKISSLPKDHGDKFVEVIKQPRFNSYLWPTMSITLEYKADKLVERFSIL